MNWTVDANRKRLDMCYSGPILRTVMRLEDSLRTQAASRFLIADQLVLDCADRRVWMASIKLDLGSKALSLLEELMQHPQMLVTKDRLFDVGWPDQAVSDAVLTTAIRELRRALADSARSPEWIETHHGKGYRFLKRVEARAVHPGRGAERKEHASGNPKFTVRPWVAIAGLLTALLAVLVYFQFQPGATRKEQLSSVVNVSGVAVLPFTVDGGEDWIGSAMSSRLTSVLGNAPGLFVADNQLVAAMAESDDPWQVARSDRIGVIVVGVVRVAADQIDVDVTIRNREGEDLWARRISDNQEQIIGLTERVAIETARALKIAADPQQTAEMARLGTKSIPAFEHYSRANYTLNSVDAFKKPELIDDALDHLRQAIAIDPTFAKAAATLSWFEFPDPYDGDAASAEGKALALGDIASSYAVDEIDRELSEASLAMRQLRLVEARQKLQGLYKRTRATSAETNHSILLQLSYIAAATRDRNLAEQAWRELTDYNLARGRIQFLSPTFIAHSKPLLLRYVDNLAQQEETAIGVFNAHTALLLAGERDMAREVMKNGQEVVMGPLKTIMEIGQACGEGETRKARELAGQALGPNPKPSLLNWKIAQIAGLSNRLSTLRPPARDDASQRALLEMMGEPGFDPSPYPLIVSALGDAGVRPTPVARSAYFCPKG